MWDIVFNFLCRYFHLHLGSLLHQELYTFRWAKTGLEVFFAHTLPYATVSQQSLKIATTSYIVYSIYYIQIRAYHATHSSFIQKREEKKQSKRIFKKYIIIYICSNALWKYMMAAMICENVCINAAKLKLYTIGQCEHNWAKVDTNGQSLRHQLHKFHLLIAFTTYPCQSLPTSLDVLVPSDISGMASGLVLGPEEQCAPSSQKLSVSRRPLRSLWGNSFSPSDLRITNTTLFSLNARAHKQRGYELTHTIHWQGWPVYSTGQVQ